MCGIFGYIGPNKKAPKIVLEGLKSLEYRGYDSWGVAVITGKTNQKISIKRRVGKIGDANVDDLPESSFAFGHTRWATHGGITVANTHPHLDCEEKIALVHNGIIENYLTLKNGLASQHKFRSETDTEVAVHMIENELKKETSLEKAVLKVFRKLKGNNAIIVANQTKRELVAAKNGSPLILGFGKNENYLASDAAALLPYTKEVYFLEDGEAAVLTDKKIKVLDIKSGKEISFKKVVLGWNIKQATKGSYEYFMEKEIYEQPKIINDIALRAESETKKITDLLSKYNDIVFVGCGSASFQTWLATHLFSGIAHKRVTWTVASEFEHLLPFVNKKTLIFAISQSGETMDLLEIIKKAQRQGAKVVTLINVLGSTLYRLADERILIGAGPEKSVASTKALTGMASHLIRLAYSLDGRYKEGQELLIKASRASQKILTPKSWKELRNLAKRLIKTEHIFVIGRGISTVTAAETTLKIKEISYIHAESLLGGELKHGTLALVEKGTPCIVIAPEDNSYDAIISSAMEIKARGGFVVGIGTKQNPAFDVFIQVPYLKEATVIPIIVASQVLAYNMTRLKNLDPDMPRNLAKSVTVK